MPEPWWCLIPCLCCSLCSWELILGVFCAVKVYPKMCRSHKHTAATCFPADEGRMIVSSSLFLIVSKSGRMIKGPYYRFWRTLEPFNSGYEKGWDGSEWQHKNDGPAGPLSKLWGSSMSSDLCQWGEPKWDLFCGQSFEASQIPTATLTVGMNAARFENRLP